MDSIDAVDVCIFLYELIHFCFFFNGFNMDGGVDVSKAIL